VLVSFCGSAAVELIRTWSQGHRSSGSHGMSSLRNIVVVCSNLSVKIWSLIASSLICVDYLLPQASSLCSTNRVVSPQNQLHLHLRLGTRLQIPNTLLLHPPLSCQRCTHMCHLLPQAGHQQYPVLAISFFCWYWYSLTRCVRVTNHLPI
jgi:hypothetical protein